MVKRYLKYAYVASLALTISLFAVGCSQKTVSTGGDMESGTAPAMESQTGQQSGQDMSDSAGMGMGSEESLDATAESSTPSLTILEGRTTGPMLPVYYDFDKSNVRADQQSRIEKNATYLKDNQGVRIVVEGNCDERGTNEYNMALGERRALSAKKYLVNLGVSASRINTISYGEEKPLNHGHDELAWSQNRRSDFVQK